MNLRNFTVISAVAMLVLGGCVVIGNPDGTGGAGGTGGGGIGGEVGTGASGGGAACTPTAGEEKAETSCGDKIDNDCDGNIDALDNVDCCEPAINTVDNCYTCSEVVTFVKCTETPLCATDSLALYETLVKTACDAAGGVCVEKCAAELCAGLPVTEGGDCAGCLAASAAAEQSQCNMNTP